MLPYARGITFSCKVIDLDNPLEVVPSHPNPKPLAQTASSMVYALRRAGGLCEMRSVRNRGNLEGWLEYRPKARTLGLTLEELARQAHTAYLGAEAVRVQRGREEVRVYVRLPADERDSITDVEGYLLSAVSGAEVPVLSVASLNSGVLPPAIRRKGGQRVVMITADVDPAVISGDEANSIPVNSILADLTALHPDPTYTRTRHTPGPDIHPDPTYTRTRHTPLKMNNINASFWLRCIASSRLPEEFILMLFNEETGYFHQVHGWELNCAVVGAVLAELSLLSRIDTDMESLHLVDPTETGNPILDPILKAIADEPVRRSAQYWIERLAVQAESIIDSTLDRLVDLEILKHHDGEFWTLAPTTRYSDLYGHLQDDTADQFIKTRISVYIFTDAIPDPRDIIIICLVNTCDVFRFIFELDGDAEERIRFICKMDLIGRSIAAAVEHNIASPLLRRSSLAKQIPTVSLRQFLLNRHMRNGNVPALLANLAKKSLLQNS